MQVWLVSNVKRDSKKVSIRAFATSAAAHASCDQYMLQVAKGPWEEDAVKAEGYCEGYAYWCPATDELLTVQTIEVEW